MRIRLQKEKGKKKQFFSIILFSSIHQLSLERDSKFVCLQRHRREMEKEMFDPSTFSLLLGRCGGLSSTPLLLLLS